MGYNEEKNELTHWGNSNGKHKYIAKEMVNGKMRYYYTQAELAAAKM